MKARLLLCMLLPAVVLAPRVCAQNVIWTDGNNSQNFSDPLNWMGGAVPVSTQTVEFGSTSNPGITLDEDFTANLTVLFDSSTTAFDITGTHTLTLVDGITSTSTSGGSDTVAVPIFLTDNVALTNASGNGGLVLTGGISGPGDIQLEGTGLVGLGGTNTMAGIIVRSGVLTDENPNAFSPSGDLDVASGALVLENFSESVQGLNDASGGGAVNVSGGAVLTVAAAANGTFSGTIEGAGGFSVSGSGGGETLLGTNTYTGPTTLVGSAVLQLGTNGTTGSIVSDVSGSGTLVFMRSDTYVYPGVLSGTLSVNQAGTGTVVLTGDNTYTGPTTLFNGGTLQIDSNGTTGSIVSNVSGSGTLTFERSDTYTYAGTLSGGINVNQAGTGTLILSGNNSFSDTVTAFSGILMAGSADAFGGSSGETLLSLTGTATVDLNGFSNTVGNINTPSTTGMLMLSGGAVLTLENSAGNSQFASPITGTGSLVSGVRTLNLSAANTYSGGTEVTAGEVFVTNTSGSGIGTGPLTIDNGATFTIGSQTANGSIDTSVPITDEGSLIFARTDSTTFPNTVTGGGTVEFGGVGETVTYNGVGNSYSGNTLVDANTTLRDGGANVYSPQSLMSVDGTLQVNFSETVNGLTSVGSGGQVVFTSGTALTLANTSEGSAYLGTISGPGQIVIAAPGNGQAFSGQSTYTGGTNVVEGNLVVGSSTLGPPGSITSGPVGTGTVNFQGNTEITPTDASITLANAIVLNGTGAVANEDEGGFALSLSGAISGTNGFTWNSTGAFSLSGNNDFRGGIEMQVGLLLLGSDTAAGTGLITLDNESALSAAGTGVTRIIPNDINVEGNVEFGNSDSSNITMSGQISGEASITYEGGTGGILTLSHANNSFDGPITVASGTLAAGTDNAFGSSENEVTLNGNGAALFVAPGVTVNNPIATLGTGNVLAGSGTVGSSITVDSSLTLNPTTFSNTNSPGTLSFTSGVQFSPGGTFRFNLADANGPAGTGYGSISVSSTLDVSSLTPTSFSLIVATVNAGGVSGPATFFVPTNPYSWTFATASGGLIGFNASGFAIDASQFVNATNGGTFSVTDTPTSLILNFTPVPEPSTWAMLGTGLVLLGLLAKRRRLRAGA